MKGHKKEIINIWENDNNWYMEYPRPVYVGKARIEHWIVNFLILYTKGVNILDVEGYAIPVDLGKTLEHFSLQDVKEKFRKAREKNKKSFLKEMRKFENKFENFKPYLFTIYGNWTKDWQTDIFWKRLKRKYSKLKEKVKKL